jgi:hypothetical protein
MKCSSSSFSWNAFHFYNIQSLILLIIYLFIFVDDDKKQKKIGKQSIQMFCFKAKQKLLCQVFKQYWYINKNQFVYNFILIVAHTKQKVI